MYGICNVRCYFYDTALFVVVSLRDVECTGLSIYLALLIMCNQASKLAGWLAHVWECIVIIYCSCEAECLPV